MIKPYHGVTSTIADTAFIEDIAVTGAPARVKRPLREAELAWLKASARNDVQYARDYLTG